MITFEVIYPCSSFLTMSPVEVIGKSSHPWTKIGPWEIWMKFYICNFQMDFNDWWLRYPLWNYANINVTGLHWWLVNIGSGNGLALSGSKPLPDPMLAQISPYGISRPQWVNFINCVMAYAKQTLGCQWSEVPGLITLFNFDRYSRVYHCSFTLWCLLQIKINR